MRSIVPVIVTLIVVATTVRAGTLPRPREATHLCKKLSPATDSIPHTDSDPSCSTTYPEYLYQNECICNFPVAEADANGCTIKYFVRCVKDTSLKIQKLQSPGSESNVSADVEVLLTNNTTESSDAYNDTAVSPSKSIQNGAGAESSDDEADVPAEVTTESTVFILPAAYAPLDTTASENSTESSQESDLVKDASASSNNSAAPVSTENKAQVSLNGSKGTAESPAKSSEQTESAQNEGAPSSGKEAEANLDEAQPSHSGNVENASDASNSSVSASRNASLSSSTDDEGKTGKSNEFVSAVPYDPEKSAINDSQNEESTTVEIGSAALSPESAASVDSKTVETDLTTLPPKVAVSAAPYGPEQSIVGVSQKSQNTASDAATKGQENAKPGSQAQVEETEVAAKPDTAQSTDTNDVAQKPAKSAPPGAIEKGVSKVAPLAAEVEGKSENATYEATESENSHEAAPATTAAAEGTEQSDNASAEAISEAPQATVASEVETTNTEKISAEATEGPETSVKVTSVAKQAEKTENVSGEAIASGTAPEAPASTKTAVEPARSDNSSAEANGESKTSKEESSAATAVADTAESKITSAEAVGGQGKSKEATEKASKETGISEHAPAEKAGESGAPNEDSVASVVAAETGKAPAETIEESASASPYEGIPAATAVEDAAESKNSSAEATGGSGKSKEATEKAAKETAKYENEPVEKAGESGAPNEDSVASVVAADTSKSENASAEVIEESASASPYEGTSAATTIADAAKSDNTPTNAVGLSDKTPTTTKETAELGNAPAQTIAESGISSEKSPAIIAAAEDIAKPENAPAEQTGGSGDSLATPSATKAAAEPKILANAPSKTKGESGTAYEASSNATDAAQKTASSQNASAEVIKESENGDSLATKVSAEAPKSEEKQATAIGNSEGTSNAAVSAAKAAEDAAKPEKAQAESKGDSESSDKALKATKASAETAKYENEPVEAIAKLGASNEDSAATIESAKTTKSENASAEATVKAGNSNEASSATKDQKSDNAPGEASPVTVVADTANLEKEPDEATGESEKSLEVPSTSTAAVESEKVAEIPHESKEPKKSKSTGNGRNTVAAKLAVSVSGVAEVTNTSTNSGNLTSVASETSGEDVAEKSEPPVVSAQIDSTSSLPYNEKLSSENTKSSIDAKSEQDKHASPENEKCPSSNSGCIFDDEVEGTDCALSGNSACRAVGASYCSAVFGSPAKRVCCKIKGVDHPKPNPDVAGCAPSNLGCIFDDNAEGTDCTKVGNSVCHKVGADYCGAFVEGKRVCCAVGNQTVPQFKEDGSEGCPVKNGGCIFDHNVNGADCTTGGSKHCASVGSDYCSAKFGSPPKRVCCSISGVGAAPEGGDGSKACPVKNSGCIFGHSASKVDCATGDDAICKAAGFSYCSAFFGSPSKRVCCTAGAVDVAQIASLVDDSVHAVDDSAQAANVSLQEDAQPESISVTAKPY